MLLSLIGLLAFTSCFNLQAQEFDGYALFNKSNDNTTFLIDKNGDIAHSWSLSLPCNYAVLLMPNGNIMRGATAPSNEINGAAVGGVVQEIDPDGNIVWSFTYSSSTYVAHHDITLMPDGNVLLTAWEVKTAAELQAMGYTGTSSTKYPTHFVEVSQNGTGGEIVWEWHIWDHMIQDEDPNKPNYGVVSEHPELMDINVAVSGGGGGPGGGGPGGGGGDWFHVNGVDYNPVLDQITFSSRYLSEIMIIDHSTTTEEAASHRGGNSDKGGDILYRWGKPSNYGVSGTQTIAGAVHDARWITNDGRPRGGYIQFFNNVGGSGGSSVVDAIKLPFAADGYNYEWTPGEAYGPTTSTWRHECLDDADGQSASNSMPNGNVFVNLSRSYMYEADAEGNVVWQYNSESPKGFRYVCSHPGIQKLTTDGVLENLCGDIVSTEDIAKESLLISPNPSTGIFNIRGLLQEQQVSKMQVFNMLGEEIQELGNVSEIDLTDHASGIYFLHVQFDNHQSVTKKILLDSK
ncbi:MAG: aryl-sulfate sulfotransferase [Chitinophagales bacterium]